MDKMLQNLGFKYEDGSVSITNIVVYVFVFITSFKVLFSGLEVNTDLFKWKVETLDLANSLPLLFSLMNYGHRRMVDSQTVSEEKS